MEEKTFFWLLFFFRAQSSPPAIFFLVNWRQDRLVCLEETCWHMNHTKSSMRSLNIEKMKIVHYGEEWTHPLPPSSKEMSGVLEKNEKIVSWVQPIEGTIEEQIPVWRSGGEYYKLSLRMMKSIFRHVRLRKGFVNRESALFGGDKLRIPRVLLLEKMRTQHRFNVSLASSLLLFRDVA